MAFEPGGYADKLGNRHEGRWVAWQLLRLLREDIHSVLVEAIGDDEIGVDLWIEHLDGIREAQQCKARNHSKEYWNIADLNTRGILSRMKLQLDRDPQYQFALVTAVPATVFSDICESARRSNDDPNDFFQYQVQAIGADRRKVFRQFCENLGLDQARGEDRRIAFDYLRRTYVHVWPDDQNSWEQLSTNAGLLASGAPNHIVSALIHFAEDNIRKTLTSNVVRQYLAKEGFPPRDLSHDDRISPAVEILQEQFVESIAPDLIAGGLIPRRETTQILDALGDGAFVIVHGTAGHGKSSVLYELFCLLKEQGHSVLPIRLDRKVARHNTKQFGAELGLPESPVRCLASLIGDTFGVLVLDQLDALRWTSQHSGDSLDVCKSLVREAESLRAMGKRVCVVVSCRTFDLEHDPEISKWLDESRRQMWRKVLVGALADEDVKAVVEGSGHRFSDFTSRQKRILQSPLHLGMWVKLVQTGHQTDFHNSAQLLEEFWTNRKRQFERAGLAVERADLILGKIATYMEHNSRLYAPHGVTANYPKEMDILCSEGVLQREDGKLSFRHQSYLDYLIARRLLDSIYQGNGDVCQWLGTKETQSLFRREQLRQILSLLSIEAPDNFLSGVRAILADSQVRFFMKHLALEVIAEIEKPTHALRRYLTELLEDDYWEEHIFGTVFLRHAHHVQWLLEARVIEKWLYSDEPADINKGLWLLQSVNEQLSTEVAQILEPFLAHDDEWRLRVVNCIDPRGDADSEQMFELRLGLARQCLLSSWIDWRQLADRYPSRALRLIEAAISTWSAKDVQAYDFDADVRPGTKLNIDNWSQEELSSLKTAAISQPELTWDLLVPQIERLTANEHRVLTYRRWDSKAQLDGAKSITPTNGIMQVVIAAGKKLANDQPELLFSRTRLYQSTSSCTVRLIIVEVYATLLPTHADAGIRWLISHPTHFDLGPGFHEPKWMPAVRLVQNLSPHCNRALFEDLESLVLDYHEPEERTNAKHYLEAWKSGYRRHYWGEAQYFLLPALCSTRGSPKSTELMRVLERKFDDRSSDLFLDHPKFIGGWVGSSIPSSRLDRISDYAWLGIVSNKAIPLEHSQWEQVDSDHVVESTIHQFSRNLGTITARFPERFGQLSLRFPPDVHRDYVAAILGGMAAVTPPQTIPAEEKPSWQPARLETVEAVLARFGSCDDRETAMNFCRLVEQRADEKWSAATIARLVRYAMSHPDPEHGRLNINSGKSGDQATVELLFQNSINCVRGVAAHAIAALMRTHPPLMPDVQPAIDSLLTDSHPAVRMAAIEVCLARIGIENDQAVKWFLIAVDNDYRIAAFSRASIVFNYVARSHHEEVAPLVRRMLISKQEDVATQAASEVTARWLFYDLFVDEVQQCLSGTSAQRKGVAQVASHFIGQNEYSCKCRSLLDSLFDDSDTDVLQMVSQAFINPSILSIPDADSFVSRYIGSPAYQHDPSPLLRALKRHEGSLLPYAGWLLEICKVFAGPLRESSRDIQTGIAADASSIPSLILRLYEQACEIADHEKANQCLDAWDMLFENRVGMTRDLAKSMMQ